MAKAIRCILLAALLLGLPLGSTAQAGPTARASIVGGSDAAIAEFPFQVGVLRPAVVVDGVTVTSPYETQFCGGFILDATHVGTAAHCVFDDATQRAEPPGLLQVLANTDTLRRADQPAPAPGEQRVTVRSVAFRPGFDPATYDDDAAVLTLTEPLTGPAVALAATPLDPGDDVTVTGWGTTQAAVDPFPVRLQEVTLDVVADGAPTCAQVPELQPYAPERKLCAAAPGKDSCIGDSGGPLVRMEPAGTRPAGWRLSGIVSYGLDPCANDEAAGVYAEVWNGAPANAIDEFLQAPFAPPAPRPTEPIEVRGDVSPGGEVTCHSRWSDVTSENVRLRRTPPGAAPELVDVPYVVSAVEVGWKLACVVTATGDGGHGRAESLPVTVQAPPAPPAAAPPAPAQPAPAIVQPPAPRDTARPTTSLVRRGCSRTLCTLQLQVSDPPYTSGIRLLRASGSLAYRSRCRRDGRTRACTRTRKLSVRPALLGAGRYLVRVRSRTNGLATLRFVAYDNAGNRQARAKQLRVRYGPKPAARSRR